MNKNCFAIIYLIAVFTILCITTAFASIDTQTASIVSKLQGQWYDENGNVAFDFEGNTVNGCPIVGAYHPAGGSGDFSCTLRIIENESYKDLFLICSHVGKLDYHSSIILNGDNLDASKGTMLLRTKTAQYYETVGGIGIDMPANEVLAKYGKPDISRIWRGIPGEYLWKYNRMGLELVMRHNRVERIRILKDGDRHFDRTGFNCANAPYEFQEVYGFKNVPRAGKFGAFWVGHGEYLWFHEYPDCIEMSTYYN